MKPDRTQRPAEPAPGASRHPLAQGLAERYGDSRGAALDGNGWPHGIKANVVLESLLAHRSVRAYDASPLPAGLLPVLLAAAQSASTSSHLQAWSVVAIEDGARKSRLAAFCGGQGHVAKAPLLLVFVADLSRLRGAGAATGMAADGLDYLESFIVGVADAALAAQNMVVALESLGLGCCYIGAMRNAPEAVALELGLPPESFAVFGLTVGHPDPAQAAAVKPRLPQAVVLHHEVYTQPGRAAFDDYDARMKLFQRGQRMAEAGWTGPAAARVRGPDAMSGRDKLQDALKRLGFGLM